MRSVLAEVLGIAALFLVCFISFSNYASAASVYACNSTGHVKESFYENETVYVRGNGTADKSVEIYIVGDRTSWSNGTSLTGLSLGYKIVQTNSSGGINVTVLWDKPNTGNYDVILDDNNDRIYNTNVDAVDNTTRAGFTVLATPKPTITVIYGEQHPADHEHDLEEDTGHNVMMQFNLTVNNLEDVRIQSIGVTARGSGNDREDITVVYLVYDNNNNGVYDSGEALLGYGSFSRDDGAVFFNLEANAFEISKGKSMCFLITYSMNERGSVDDDYTFELITITATGKSSGDPVVINGLPLESCTKTISHAAPTTTTTVPTTTTTTIPVDECQTDSDCVGVGCSGKKKTSYTCKYDTTKGVNICAAAIANVECCNDRDCVEGYYCLNYDCVKETAGGPFGWLAGGGAAGADYTWTIVSIVVVVLGAILIFIAMKNRRKKMWKSKEHYERNWDELRKKWER